MSSKGEKKEKKQFDLNPFAMLFCVIILCFIASYFVAPGAFDREVVDGTNRVVAGSYHAVEKKPLAFFDIFRSIPNGLIDSGSIVFLVLIVGGSIEIFNKTGAIPMGISRMVMVAGKNTSALMLVLLFAIFAVLGGFLGWVEAAIPFIPLVVPIVLALGFDSLVASAVCILGCMVGFAVGPTNMYTVGIAHQIAELPMFSGFGYRFIVYIVFCAASLIYLMFYALRAKKDPSRSLMADVDVSDLRKDYTESSNAKFTVAHKLSLLILAATFVIVVYGMMKLKWTINDMSAAFLLAGLLAGVIGRLKVDELASSLIIGAKASLGGALIVGVARGVQWIMTKSGLLDPVINSLSGYLDHLGATGSAIGIFVVSLFLDMLVASGSGKAVALMPIIIPLADLVGVTRQTAILAYQFGDGLANMAWFTYGTLLIFLSYGKVSIAKWYKFLWPLFAILCVLAIIFLVIAVKINYV